MQNCVFLSLGSNIDPDTNIVRAVRLLSEFGEIEGASTVWETKPIGAEDQANFLNAVIHFSTRLSYTEIQETTIPTIEKKLGRARGKNKFCPRSIDIDILLFNDLIGEFNDRKLPNPEIIERAFVAIPMAELAPDLIHPEFKLTMTEIAEKFVIDPHDMWECPTINLNKLD